jgi:hypothetical protein
VSRASRGPQQSSRMQAVYPQSATPRGATPRGKTGAQRVQGRIDCKGRRMRGPGGRGPNAHDMQPAPHARCRMRGAAGAAGTSRGRIGVGAGWRHVGWQRAWHWATHGMPRGTGAAPRAEASCRQCQLPSSSSGGQRQLPSSSGGLYCKIPTVLPATGSFLSTMRTTGGSLRRTCLTWSKPMTRVLTEDKDVPGQRRA